MTTITALLTAAFMVAISGSRRLSKAFSEALACGAWSESAAKFQR